MYDKKVSVIVPVYNGEKYLNCSLESLVKQSYKNIEILIIDDGSTDLSAAICNEWVQKDSRVICVHQKNKGVSAARNRGLEIASGDYIMFCDADDWMDTTYIESLISHIGSSQLVIGSFQQDTEEGMKARKYHDDLNAYYSKNVFFDDCVNERIYTYIVWAKLFDKKIIGNTRFISIAYSEDAIFARTVLSKCETAVFLDLKGYHYRINPYSVTSDESRIEERTAGALALIAETLLICRKQKDNRHCKLFEKKLRRMLLSYLKTGIKNPLCRPDTSLKIMKNSIGLLSSNGYLFTLKLRFFQLLYMTKLYFCPKMSIRKIL